MLKRVENRIRKDRKRDLRASVGSLSLSFLGRRPSRGGEETTDARICGVRFPLPAGSRQVKSQYPILGDP